mmetsp:Transcript_41804/g.75269  ORF Transcript_41804/g.75269 Transcript_41804/m.75269 type:complete len:1351 (-) Transcript_41804:454-4506(-)
MGENEEENDGDDESSEESGEIDEGQAEEEEELTGKKVEEQQRRLSSNEDDEEESVPRKKKWEEDDSPTTLEEKRATDADSPAISVSWKPEMEEGEVPSSSNDSSEEHHDEPLFPRRRRRRSSHSDNSVPSDLEREKVDVPPANTSSERPESTSDMSISSGGEMMAMAVTMKKPTVLPPPSSLLIQQRQPELPTTNPSSQDSDAALTEPPPSFVVQKKNNDGLSKSDDECPLKTAHKDNDSKNDHNDTNEESLPSPPPPPATNPDPTKPKEKSENKPPPPASAAASKEEDFEEGEVIVPSTATTATVAMPPPPMAANPPPTAMEDNASSSRSSSSGSTCSNSSFAGVPPTSVTANKEQAAEDSLPPLTVDVKVTTNEGSDEKLPSQEQRGQMGKAISSKDEDDTLNDVEMADDETQAVRSGAEDNPPPPRTATTITAAEHLLQHPQQEQHPPLFEKKKRGPLSIRIGLPGAKRKKIEELKLKSGGSSKEPSTKKQKLSEVGEDHEPPRQQQRLEDGKVVASAKPLAISGEEKQTMDSLPTMDTAISNPVIRSEEKKEQQGLSNKSDANTPATTLETTIAKENKAATSVHEAGAEKSTLQDDDDDSLSEGEIQEEDDTPTIEEVESKKAAAESSNNEESPPLPLEEPLKQPSHPTISSSGGKKPKLTIHISTKKRKLENIKDAEQDVESQQKPAEKESPPKQQPDDAARLPVDEEANEEKKKAAPLATIQQPAQSTDSGAEDKDSSAISAAADTSPRSEGDKSSNDKPDPSSFAGTAESHVLPPDDGDVGGKAITSRSGRKAAKRAAEKISAEKKDKPNKKSDKSKKKKAEEDPWVQCDRCHKWRHLPRSVDLDSLPEHWFCELNMYDPKRNNCEAPEQTPKEVAKEKKKRAKKLELKKLQMEQAQAELAARQLEGKTETKSRRVRSNSPKNGIDQETEFDSSKTSPEDKAASVDSDGRGKNITDDDDDETTTNTSRDDSSKPPFKPKGKRGRPRREDSNTEKNTGKGGGKDEPKQEWVQCEKCEKWRRLPPRISAEDLPDVWFCSMNTWDINLATCTAVEEKHEANPPPRGASGKKSVSTTAATEQYSEQSQIPTSFGSSSKLSYRNLIFGSGRRRQKNISERMRAQESLFSSQLEEEADMSTPPTVVYANSNVFFNKSLKKATSFEDDEGGAGVASPERTSVFDIVSCSRVWQELNNNASTFHMQNSAAYNAVGYEKYCQPNGALNQEAVDTLKAMAYFGLGSKTLVGHEILLEVQCCGGGSHQDWNVPAHWLELRSLCTIEIINFILEELKKDGLVEMICGATPKSSFSLENVFYRRILGPEHNALLPSVQEVIDQRSSCLKIRKPWKE